MVASALTVALSSCSPGKHAPKKKRKKGSKATDSVAGLRTAAFSFGGVLAQCLDRLSASHRSAAAKLKASPVEQVFARLRAAAQPARGSFLRT